MSYQVNLSKVSEWINKWKDNFDSVNPEPSSIKTLVYLVLLERQDTQTSYQDISDELSERRIVEGFVEDMSLRNGMSQIVKNMERDSLYDIEKRKIGKQALYKLIKRTHSVIKNNSFSAKPSDIVTILTPVESASMDFIAEKLMRDRQMPFYGIYLPMRAVSRWIIYSEEEAEVRRKYEGDQCELQLKNWLLKYKGQDISVIGLGVGEGIGEIELIERLLTENHGFNTIHYCAIDINIHLLLDHIERLRDKFKKEIKEGRLVCGVICGNFLDNFSSLIETMRNTIDNFLPKNSGTIVSILGNVLGNLEKRAAEWTYFKPILESFKGENLAFLLGISAQHKDKDGKIVQEIYKRNTDDLLLATPRYLTHELKILKTHQPEKNTEAGEFILPKNEAKKEARCPSVKEVTYQGDGLVIAEHVEGSIYEFFYTTQWDLSMELEDETLHIPAGTNLLIYNVIKFNLESLIGFLESKGLKAPNHSIVTHDVETENGKRVYAVLAVTT